MSTINELFSITSPTTRKIYDHLIAALESFGPITIEPKKTSLHLVHRTAFAGVHPRKNCFFLNIKADHEINHPRIHNSEKVSANRYHYRVKIENEEQIDKELLGWLQAAYELSR